MDLLLKDKVVWITGASGGIGRALAVEFGREGARLGLHGHSGAESLRRWTAEQPFAESALCVEGDTRDAAAMDACADAIARRFGRIDCCIANAGVWIPGEDLIDETPLERITTTLEVNLLGALHTARSFFAALRASGPRPDGHGASLTFVGSTAGRFGEKGHVDYAASKAGLVGAMLTLKNEIVDLDPAGRVNVVEPGWTVTHMAKPALEVPGTVERVTSTMPLRQLGRAEDIARTICALSSPYVSSHVSGEVLTVAGGMEGRLLWEAGDLEREAILARLERD